MALVILTKDVYTWRSGVDTLLMFMLCAYETTGIFTSQSSYCAQLLYMLPNATVSFAKLLWDSDLSDLNTITILKPS